MAAAVAPQPPPPGLTCVGLLVSGSGPDANCRHVKLRGPLSVCVCAFFLAFLQGPLVIRQGGMRWLVCSSCASCLTACFWASRSMCRRQGQGHGQGHDRSGQRVAFFGGLSFADNMRLLLRLCRLHAKKKGLRVWLLSLSQDVAPASWSFLCLPPCSPSLFCRLAVSQL